MKNTKWSFIALNVIGGVAVLGSYVWGFASHPELGSDFWGGVPEHIRGLYTANMFLAAAGYLLAFAFFLRHADAVRIRRLYLPYTLILLPSALWLPLTVQVLQSRSHAWWLLTRLDLFIVAAGVIWLFAAVASTPPNSGFRRLCQLGLLFFVLQTGILDALVWPAFFSV